MIFAKSKVGAAVIVYSIALLSTPLAAQIWEQRSVLLKTDSVITGLVQQQGEQIRIKQNEGNEVRVDRKQVVAMGVSVGELYQFKLSRLPKQARGGDHGQLARWCLSVNLLAEAGEHYLQLCQSHPASTHPSVYQLGVEIKDKMLQQNDFRVAIGYPPIDRHSPNPKSAANANPKLRSNQQSNVVLANATTGEISKNKISSLAQARFNEQTQHILINRCGQAACHGHATKTSFRLIEVGGRDAPSHTHQNLDSVLRYVSEDPQAKSKLIEYLTKIHGNMTVPPIGQREFQLANEVSNWVQLVQSPVVSAEGWSQSGSLNPIAPGSPQLRQVPKTPAAEPSAENAEFPEGADRPTTAELDELDALVRQQEPAIPAVSRSTPDPFDPNEFDSQTARN